ncbi:cupin domain-containing protein [Nonomuraea sp. NPDC005650]|uniref:cupin domain-containing protein n=1 Tax=Nonomuraea sp. NPDC005650 TaxID=3157045 RepID=UPI0033BB293D
MSRQTPDPVRSSSIVDDTEQMVRRAGSQIRRLRVERGLKLKDVAEMTGVSVSMLSMLERGVAGASIGTLVAVSSALGIHMSDLFDGTTEAVSPVRRFADQVQVETAQGVLRRIAHYSKRLGLEMAVNEYAPGTSSAGAAVHHSGTEFGVVIAGTLTVELEGVPHVLATGDAISFESAIPHLFRNEGDEVATAVWVNLGS